MTTDQARPLPTTYLREKLDTLSRAIDMLEDANTEKFQRLTLATVATTAEAIKAEADKWIVASVQRRS